MSIGFAPNATGNVLAGPACVTCGDSAGGPASGSLAGQGTVGLGGDKCPISGCLTCEPCDISDPRNCDTCTAQGQKCCGLHPEWVCCIAGCCEAGQCILPPGPNIMGVDVRAATNGNWVKNLPMYCVETGQFATSICGYVNFYYLLPAIYHYATPGGSGHFCFSDPFDHNWAAAIVAKNTLIPPALVDINVNLA